MIPNKKKLPLAIIRGSGHRITKSRRAVLTVLRQTRHALTGQELTAAVRNEGIGQSSVYRTLQLLSEQNLVDVSENPHHEAVYELRTKGHHHHLVCERCGKTENIRCPLPTTLLKNLERKHHFHTLRHVTSVYGLCDSCFHELNP